MAAFATLVRTLRAAASNFGAGAAEARLTHLRLLQATPLPVQRSLAEYVDALLFLRAHPVDVVADSHARAELDRVADVLQRASARARRALANTGLPFATTTYAFTHDLLRWMRRSPRYDVALASLGAARGRLNETLQFTLPAIEREITTVGWTQRELLRELVGTGDPLAFLLAELARLDEQPLLKDHLFDALGVEATLTPRSRDFSIAFNRVDLEPTFHHDALLRRFDVRELLDRPLPAPRALTSRQRAGIVAAVRDSLALLLRETDPSTYMDERTLRWYPLERGVAVAIYALAPSRQLPLESYVGYTLFKNGYPAAYGGAWVYGRRALFGINVFPPFRGGESGFVLCQLLRTYRQAFGVDTFEVEPYQYGAGNPEGLTSGAFWFYHRHGFRPVDPDLRALAEREHAKIAAGRGHRSSLATLRRFTESNVELALVAGPSPPRVADARERVTAMIRDRWGGDRGAALAACRREFAARAGLKRLPTGAAARVLDEIAPWAVADCIEDPAALAVLVRMLREKPRGPYEYQRLLLELDALRAKAPRGRVQSRARSRPSG